MEIDLTGKSQLTALIDADSIIYIVAWKNREHDDISKVLEEVDQFIVDILHQTGARQYAGFLTPKHYFRYDVATYKPYKGNRPDNPEWVKKWKPYIIQHMIDKWGFVLCRDMEADDAVAILQQSMVNTTICSPDKDLKQIPGNHFDYKTGVKVFVTDAEAMRSFFYQMMVGDTVDNIAGVPKMGPKGADNLLDTVPSNLWKLSVQNQFEKYFGREEGARMFEETRLLVRMLGPWNLSAYHLSVLQLKSLRTFDLDNSQPSSYLVPNERKPDELPFENPFAE